MKLLLSEEKDRYLAAYDARAAVAVAEPDWLASLRRLAIARFDAVGFPTTRNEAWKYTDVSPILKTEFGSSTGSIGKLSFAGFECLRAPEAEGACLVFVDGVYHPELSSMSGLAEGVVVTDFATAVAVHFDALAVRLGVLSAHESTPFASLNLAMATGGAVVLVPKGCAPASPVHLVYLSGGGDEPVAAHPRTMVVAGESSSLTVVETFASVNGVASLTNAVAEFHVGENARVDHVRVQREGAQAFHVGATAVEVRRSGSYSSIAISIGAAISRHDLHVRLAEEGASCHIDGLYVTEGEQHADSHTRIDHLVPRCSSRQLYKGVLDGDSRAVFNGKVYVHHDAQKTEAHQTNRNLMLSPRARVDTKPELEIFADDVVCSHGATVGALEAEEQFYLASRGLDEATARAVLTYGFAEEIVEEIPVASVRRHLDEVILDRFQKGFSKG